MQYPRRVIKPGESDRAIVIALQQQLLTRGYGPVDDLGVFGEQTEASVKLFQVRNVDGTGRPLKQDGELGPLTWAALFGDETVPDRMTASSQFLKVVLVHAASQVGVLEQPKNSNSGPEVNEYLKRVGVPLDLPAEKKPWCCAFVYWCFEQAARDERRANPMVRTAGCLDHWNRVDNIRGRRIDASRAIDDPGLVEPGMILIMDFGGGRGHTGLVEHVAGGILHTIEGNTDASRTREGGGVYRLTRKMVEVNKGFIDYRGA
jgi:CHAP domain/Putative peptidoglycan binding domain